MKTIQLTQGKVALVDDEDYERLVAMGQWRAMVSGGSFYAARRGKTVNGKQTTVLMHRFILNPPDGLETDHVNRDKLDNRRHNLRSATSSQNKANRSVQSRNTSGFKGAFRRGNKWRAQIINNGRIFYLGTFTTKEEAARIYDAKAKELFGEFARLNFPTP